MGQSRKVATFCHFTCMLTRRPCEFRQFSGKRFTFFVLIEIGILTKFAENLRGVQDSEWPINKQCSYYALQSSHMPKLSKLPCYKTHPLTSRLVSPRCPASLPWWHRSVRLNGTPAKLPKSVCASQRSRKCFRCKRRLSVASDEVGIWWPSFFFSHFSLSLFSMTFCNEKTCEGMIHYDIPKICRGTISRLWNGQWKTGKWVKRTSRNQTTLPLALR